MSFLGQAQTKKQPTKVSDNAVTKRYITSFGMNHSACAVSVNKDTLYVPDDSFGKLIHEVWVKFPLEKNPTIIFIKDEATMLTLLKKQSSRKSD